MDKLNSIKGYEGVTVLRECKACGIFHNKFNNWHGHCSKACYTKDHEFVDIECIVCSAPMSCTIEDSKRKLTSTCGPKCRKRIYYNMKNELYYSWFNSLSTKQIEAIRAFQYNHNEFGGYHILNWMVIKDAVFGPDVATELYLDHLEAVKADTMKTTCIPEYKMKVVSWKSFKVRLLRTFVQTPIGENLEAIALMDINCPDGYALDHIYPLSKGGCQSMKNLQYLEAQANLAKASNLPEDWDILKDHWKNALELGIRKPDILASLKRHRAWHDNLNA